MAVLRAINRNYTQSQPNIETVAADLPSIKSSKKERKKKNENLVRRKTLSPKEKAVWKVRQCLANLPKGENVNTFYLTLVRRGMLLEIDALFKLTKVVRSGRFSGFDKDYVDNYGISALTAAIYLKDEGMTRKLIENGLELGLNIFHAVEADFTEGVKLILACNKCNDLKIIRANHYFPAGLTPMLLAARHNNYRMMLLLHENDHELPVKNKDDDILSLQCLNERRIICLAMAKPAYITLHCEVKGENPMEHCLDEIKLLRQYASGEHELGNFCKDLISRYEDYMCSLLNQIQSSNELAFLFKFDLPSRQISNFIDDAKTRRLQFRDRFELLENASREKLVKFVTHQHPQLAISFLRYPGYPILRTNPMAAYFVGIFFPLFSMFYIGSPKSALGGIIRLPIVAFYCHMMSDTAFVIILILKVVVQDTEIDKLGQPLTSLEWLILFWIIGKWIREFQECANRTAESYFRDYWNYVDLMLLFLFSVSLVIRIHDATSNTSSDISRSEWDPFEPRLIGEGLEAWGYVFVFIRILELVKVHRYLGPLQISLGKMLLDVIRFLFLFMLALATFAISLTDLYRYYGTTQGSVLFCNVNTTDSGTNQSQNCATTRKAFASTPLAIADLFWALFGQFDLTTMSLEGKHVYTEWIGKSLLATYHIVAIIVMLNMLIAMMSKSYEDTSENEETAWKFHQTSVWIQFIRRQTSCPPPMNIIESFWGVSKKIWQLRSTRRQYNINSNSNANSSNINHECDAAGITNDSRFQDSYSLKYDKIQVKLIHRYKIKNFIQKEM